MSFKIIDGLQTLDGTNTGIDITPAARTDTVVNATSVDMSNHEELLAAIQIGIVDVGQSGNIKVQESNESAANFTDITSAEITWSGGRSSDSGHMIFVNWRHPDRKRYARLAATFGAANTALVGAQTVRIKNDQVLDIDDSVVES